MEYQVNIYSCRIWLYSKSIGLFIIHKKTGSSTVIILVCIDDFLITGTDLELIQEAKLMLHYKFKVKDLGELKLFLDIEFSRNKSGIVMHHWKYSLELISNLELSGS